MSKRQGYSTSHKKKELTGNDPYAMKMAPKGFLQCPECQAMYHRKRWSLPGTFSTRSSQSAAGGPKKSTRQVMVPQSFVCPACRKSRDGYAEGFLAIHWPDWGTHKTEVLGLIHHEESQATQNNPLERVMSIRTRPDGADIETTTEHFAQRLGKHLDRAFKGKIAYQWSHKDKLARVEWQGPQPETRPRQNPGHQKLKSEEDQPVWPFPAVEIQAFSPNALPGRCGYREWRIHNVKENQPMTSRIMLWSLIVLIGWAVPTGAQEPQVDPIQGEAVYQAHCVGCHGLQGRGDGPDAATLIVPPANFQRMESRAKSEMDIRSAIIWGLAFSPMHGWWDTLSVEDIRAVTAYIRRLAPYEPSVP